MIVLKRFDMSALAQRVQELRIYQRCFDFQQMIFVSSKQWPAEERYALTDQIRRSSRSIGANLSEAWAKRRYPAHFLSKLTDADGELQETLHWIRTATACQYLTESERWTEEAHEIGKMLGSMIARYEDFVLKT